MDPNGTPNGETAPIEQVKNEALDDATKLANELAEAKKKAEQAEMRARQLENAEAARKKAEEEAHQKQLEEQNEYKTLFERAEAARIKLEEEIENEKTSRELLSSKSTILSEYDSEVVELANATGIELLQNTDEAKTAFKGKLDAIASKLKISSNNVKGNNPLPSGNNMVDPEAVKMALRYAKPNDARQIVTNIVSKMPEIQEMRRQAGIK